MDIVLNPHEARVLGVLVEKAYTTPDQYPLSINAATNGCNQKSNRDPLVDFSEAEVRIALQGLRMKHLAGQSVPSGSRVEKWRHSAKETLKLEDRELAVLAELLLRGPQTAGELRSRAKRMRDIPSLDVLEQGLAALRERGYVTSQEHGRAPRSTQVLCPNLHPDGAPSATVSPVPEPAPTTAPPATVADEPKGLESRIATLEVRLDELQSTVARLQRDLGE